MSLWHKNVDASSAFPILMSADFGGWLSDENSELEAHVTSGASLLSNWLHYSRTFYYFELTIWRGTTRGRRWIRPAIAAILLVPQPAVQPTGGRWRLNRIAWKLSELWEAPSRWYRRRFSQPTIRWKRVDGLIFFCNSQIAKFQQIPLNNRYMLEDL